jgi:hypothetical protein
MTFGRPHGLLLVMALIGVLTSGCGGESQGSGGESSAIPRGSGAIEPESEYHEVLLEFRAAASAGKTYDAYGFAEYFPPTQRAAVHAFCFVTDRMLEDLEAERLGDSAYLVGRIKRKAEADMKSELDVVAPQRAQRAIRKLDAVLDLGSLDQDLAERYVRACY